VKKWTRSRKMPDTRWQSFKRLQTVCEISKKVKKVMLWKHHLSSPTMPEPNGSTTSLAPEQTAGNPVVQHTETDIQQWGTVISTLVGGLMMCRLIQALNVGFSQLLGELKVNFAGHFFRFFRRALFSHDQPYDFWTVTSKSVK
jgi:hypothetical protein